LITALNGLVVVFVVASEIWRRRRQRRRLTASVALEEATDKTVDQEQNNLAGEKEVGE
jgi:hypothetical protein